MLDTKIDTLLVTAECRNFTKAASILSLTQPAVSHHISQLESECGAQLFIRGKSELKLTKEGEIAVSYARRLKALYEKMLGQIADEKRHLTHFCIGLTHTSESNSITEVLAKYAMENANVSITIITDTINNIYDKLENHEVDAAIVEGKRISPNLNYFMLDTDYLVCAVSNENPLSRQSMVTVNDLKKQPMILRLPSSATRKLFEATLISINESIDNFDVFLEVDNVSAIKELVRKNLGISILPKSVCVKEAARGHLSILPVENLSMMREMNIAYHRDFHYMDALNQLVHLYRTTVTSD